MKLRNKILAMALVAVAGVNAYLANDIRVQRNELSLLNLENIAEADEVISEEIYNITNTSYEPKATTAVCYKTVVETKTVTNEGGGSVGISSTNANGKHSATTTTTTTTNYYVYPCLGSSGTPCTPTYVN